MGKLQLRVRPEKASKTWRGLLRSIAAVLLASAVLCLPLGGAAAAESLKAKLLLSPCHEGDIAYLLAYDSKEKYWYTVDYVPADASGRFEFKLGKKDVGKKATVFYENADPIDYGRPSQLIGGCFGDEADPESEKAGTYKTFTLRAGASYKFALAAPKAKPRAKSFRRTDILPDEPAAVTGPAFSEIGGISKDGSLVAFGMMLAEGEPDGEGFWEYSDMQIYLRDVKKNKTVLVTKGLDGRESNGGVIGSSSSQRMSGSGRYVVFSSEASDLVENDTNGKADVFLYDSRSGMVMKISGGAGERQSNGQSIHPVISGNGRYVYYSSDATNLLGARSAEPGFFVYDAKTGKTKRLPVKTSIKERSKSIGSLLKDRNRIFGVSSSGRYLLLAKPNKGGYLECYRYDVKSGKTIKASNPRSGNAINGSVDNMSMSASGRYIAFSSSASNIARGVDIERIGVFLFDCKTGKTSLVDKYAAETSTAGQVSISPDGRRIVYITGDNGINTLCCYDRAKKQKRVIAYLNISNWFVDNPALSNNARSIAVQTSPYDESVRSCLVEW